MYNDIVMTMFLLLYGLGFWLLFFGGSGGWALFVALSDKKKATLSRNWLSIPGRIVSSQIVEVVHHDSDGTHSGLQLDVEYEYSVAGIQYLNNKHTPGRIPKGIPYRRVAEVENRYALNATVPVFYNPRNPQESCLEREAPLSNLTMVIGIVLLIIAACGVCALGTLLATTISHMVSGFQATTGLPHMVRQDTFYSNYWTASVYLIVTISKNGNVTLCTLPGQPISPL
jgi:hypothetical protein